MNLVRIVRESRAYGVVSTLRRWARESTAVSLARSERAIQVVVGVALTVSTARVALADLNAAVKFLSFAVLFLLTVVVASPFTEPPAE